MDNTFFIIDGKRISTCRARILILQCYGLSRKQIAAILQRSVNTISSHLDDLHKMLQFTNQTEVVGWCFDNGLRNNGYVQGQYIFDGYTDLPWDANGKKKGW